MAEFAVYVGGVLRGIEQKPSRPADIAAKGVAWYPVARPAPEAHNPKTHKLIGPTVALTNGQHVISYAVVVKTAQEISDDKDAELSRYNRLSELVNFDQENRQRAVERAVKVLGVNAQGLSAGQRATIAADLPPTAQNPVTDTQYHNALKAHL